MSTLISAISLPNGNAPQRYPSFPALDRTAVMAFSVPSTLQVPAATTYEVMLARQAAWPAWAPQQFSMLCHQTTYLVENLAGAGDTAWSAAVPGIVSAWGTSNKAAGNTGVGITGATQYYSYPIIGKDTDSAKVYTYIPPGASAHWVVGATGATGFANAQAITVEWSFWTGPGSEAGMDFTNITLGAGLYAAMSSDITSSVARWVCPRQVAGTQTAGTVPATTVELSLVIASGPCTFVHTPSTLGTVTPAAGNPTLFMPLVTPAEFANSVLPWSDTRVTATSLLATNVTQVLNKGGTVLCGRVSPSVVDPFLVSPAYVNTLHPAEKAFLPLETGFYTFIPPGQDMLNFSSHVLPTRGVQVNSLVTPLAAPLYDLASNAPVHFMFVSSATAAETLAITVDWHIEFKTSSALFQIGVSKYSLETMHQTQLVLGRQNLFMSNFNHIAILSGLKTALSAALGANRFGMNLIDPSLVGMAKGMWRRATRQSDKTKAKPRTTVPATSGVRSGMIDPGTVASQQVALSRLPPWQVPTVKARKGTKRRGGLSLYLSRRGKGKGTKTRRR